MIRSVTAVLFSSDGEEDYRTSRFSLSTSQHFSDRQHLRDTERVICSAMIDAVVRRQTVSVVVCRIDQSFRLQFRVRAFQQSDNVVADSCRLLQLDRDRRGLLEIYWCEIVALGFRESLCACGSRRSEQLIGSSLADTQKRRYKVGHLLFCSRFNLPARQVIGDFGESQSLGALTDDDDRGSATGNQAAHHARLRMRFLPRILADLRRWTITQQHDFAAHVDTSEIVTLQEWGSKSVSDENEIAFDIFVTAVRRAYEEVCSRLEGFIAGGECRLQKLRLAKFDWLKVCVLVAEWFQSEFSEAVSEIGGSLVATWLRGAATLHVVGCECVDGFFDRGNA